jgi:uncharacterized repeat protein (TIGR03803 family)
LTLATLCCGAAQAQSPETAIWNFAGGQMDGGFPQAKLIFDSDGNLYGTTALGGNYYTSDCGTPPGCGAVFELSPPVGGGTAWLETVLYNFCNVGYCADGMYPMAGLVRSSQGTLYGTTLQGGGGEAYPAAGALFSLTPPTGGGATWTERVLYGFCLIQNPLCGDGAYPYGDLVLDAQGNLYGTTSSGGAGDHGVVFEFDPTSGYTVLHSFCSQADCTDGGNPGAGLIFDAQGNLYGTTSAQGANGGGTVFELSPPSGGGTAWTYTVLYSFCALANCADGQTPVAELIFDSSGNLYGTTEAGGTSGNGTVFELSPPSGGGSAWAESVLYSFCSQANCADGSAPKAGLILDAGGDLYGTTQQGGTAGEGTVFKVRPPSGGGSSWAETVLYNFCAEANCADGAGPLATLIFDAKGNLYGTTQQGGTTSAACGTTNCGVVFELSPLPATDTSLALAPSTVSIGSSAPVVMAAAVTPASGSGTPTGTVAFLNGGTQVGTGTLSGGGVQYDYDPSALAPGTYSITAFYSGDSSFGASVSAPQILTVTAQGTTTALASSANPSIFGQAVTFTATITPSAGPTGTVAFTADGTTLSGCAAVTLSAGTAQCATSTLAVDSHTIVAAYSGDSTYPGSSGTLTQVVGASPGSFALAASPGSQSVNSGSAAAYTITVTAQGGFAGPVVLSCAGAPAGGACVFSQSLLQVPAGGSAGTTMMVVTAQQNAQFAPPGGSRPWGTPLGLGLTLGMGLIGLTVGLVTLASPPNRRRRTARRARRRQGAHRGCRLVFLLIVPAMAAALVSCGGSSGGPSQSYTIKITATSTATSPAIVQSTSVSLAVAAAD